MYVIIEDTCVIKESMYVIIEDTCVIIESMCVIVQKDMLFLHLDKYETSSWYHMAC
jgi:hypothetical protein